MANHFSEFDPFDIPPEYRPLGAWAYIGYSLLFSIPILGFIFTVVFSFSGANYNRRNYARMHLILTILAVIFLLVMYFTGVLSQALTNTYGDSIPSYLSWLVRA